MNKAVETKNKALVRKAVDTLFNRRDYAAAERFWSPEYRQHSADIGPGRSGLFQLIKSAPKSFKYELGLVLADNDYVMLHGRFSGFGARRSRIAVDIVRVVDGQIVEHWDVLQDEATEQESRSGAPMFGDRFAEVAQSSELSDALT